MKSTIAIALLAMACAISVQAMAFENFGVGHEGALGSAFAVMAEESAGALGGIPEKSRTAFLFPAAAGILGPLLFLFGRSVRRSRRHRQGGMAIPSTETTGNAPARLATEIGMLVANFRKMQTDLKNASHAVGRLVRVVQVKRSVEEIEALREGKWSETFAEVNVMIETFETAVKFASSYMALVAGGEGAESVASLHPDDLDAVEGNLKLLASAMGSAAAAAEELVMVAGLFHDTTVSSWAEMQTLGSC